MNVELNQDGSQVIPKDWEQGENSPSAQANDWEKRYKDTQWFATKKNQALIDFARTQVEKDPASIKEIPDKDVQKKILQDKWGVDSIDELETLYPEALKIGKGKNEQEDEEDKFATLERKVKLMEYKEAKTKTQDAIEEIKSTYKDVIATIDGFDEKLLEEMKYISQDLSPKERVNKAFKVIASSVDVSDVYSLLQGLTAPKANQKETISEEALTKAQNDILSYMWVKKKN